MNGVGIDIEVKTSQLSNAKKAILDTSSMLDDLKKRTDGGIEIDAKSNVPNLVQEMVDSMRKLEGFASKATKNGGVKSGERESAQRTLDKFKADAAAYDSALGKIGRNLDQLYEKKKRLESVPFTSPNWNQAQTELSAVNKEYAASVGGYEKLQAKYDPRVDRARAGASQVEQGMGAFPTLPDGGKSGGLGLGKIFGYGASLLGGLSIVNLLHDSINKAGSYYSNESDFQMRTGKGLSAGALSSASGYGYAPGDTLGVYDVLNRRTGLKNGGLAALGDQAMLGSRAWGISTESVVGYHAGMFPNTTMAPDELKKQTERLQRIAEGIGQGGRIEEILKRNQEITASAAQAMGRALTQKEVEGITDLQMKLWATGANGQGSLGQSKMDALQGIANGGGSTRGRIFAYLSAGGGSAQNISEHLSVLENMQSPMDKQKSERLLNSVRGLPGAVDGSGRFTDWAVQHLIGLSDGKLTVAAARSIVADANNGALNATLPLGPDMNSKLKQYKGTSGAKHMQTMAEMELTKVDLGGDILPWVDKFKSKLPLLYRDIKSGSFLSAIPDFLKDNPLGDIMAVAGGLSMASKLKTPSVLPVAIPKGGGGALRAIASPAVTAIATGAELMYSDGQVGEDAIAKVITRPGSTKADVDAEAKRQAEANHGSTGDWIEKLYQVMVELSMYLHELNHDPIRKAPGAQGHKY